MEKIVFRSNFSKRSCPSHFYSEEITCLSRLLPLFFHRTITTTKPSCIGGGGAKRIFGPANFSEKMMDFTSRGGGNNTFFQHLLKKYLITFPWILGST